MSMRSYYKMITEYLPSPKITRSIVAVTALTGLILSSGCITNQNITTNWDKYEQDREGGDAGSGGPGGPGGPGGGAGAGGSGSLEYNPLEKKFILAQNMWRNR